MHSLGLDILIVISTEMVVHHVQQNMEQLQQLLEVALISLLTTHTLVVKPIKMV